MPRISWSIPLLQAPTQRLADLQKYPSVVSSHLNFQVQKKRQWLVTRLPLVKTSLQLVQKNSTFITRDIMYYFGAACNFLGDPRMSTKRPRSRWTTYRSIYEDPPVCVAHAFLLILYENHFRLQFRLRICLETIFSHTLISTSSAGWNLAYRNVCPADSSCVHRFSCWGIMFPDLIKPKLLNSLLSENICSDSAVPVRWRNGHNTRT